MTGITEMQAAASQNETGLNACAVDYQTPAKVGLNINGEKIAVGVEGGKIVVEKYTPTPAPLPASPDQEAESEWLE